MQQGAEYIKKNYCLNIEVPEIIDGVNNILKNFYKNEVQLKKGVSEVLGFLKTQHIPSAIATATNKILIDSAFNRLCIDKYFIDILTCSDVGKSKSEPDIYIALQQKMGFPPEEILICEDSAEAAYTAANAGFLTAGIYDAQNEYQQMKLKKICKFYLPDFTFFPYAAII